MSHKRNYIAVHNIETVTSDIIHIVTLIHLIDLIYISNITHLKKKERKCLGYSAGIANEIDKGFEF